MVQVECSRTISTFPFYSHSLPPASNNQPVADGDHSDHEALERITNAIIIPTDTRPTRMDINFQLTQMFHPVSLSSLIFFHCARSTGINTVGVCVCVCGAGSGPHGSRGPSLAHGGDGLKIAYIVYPKSPFLWINCFGEQLKMVHFYGARRWRREERVCAGGTTLLKKMAKCRRNSKRNSGKNSRKNTWRNSRWNFLRFLFNS